MPPSEQLEAVPVPMLRKGIANLVALTCIQVANALLPLVAYPLILGVVGAVPFSRIVVTESVALVVLAVVIYSFDVEGVSSIAGLNWRDHGDEISVIFSDILIVRLLILSACVVPLAFLYPFIDRTTFWLLAGWTLFPLSYVLQSTWFFQGLERNVLPAIVIVASRLLCLFLIRTLIVHPQDFYLAPLIIGVCYSSAGAVLLGYASMKYGMRIKPISAERVRLALLRGKEIFVGGLSVALYRGSNVLILNALSTSKAVVIYSIAEKTIKVFQAGAGPLNQLFFPKVIRALRGTSAPSRSTFKVVLTYTAPQLALLGLGAATVATTFIFFQSLLPAPFRSPQGQDILRLVVIMAPTVFFGVANFMFGTGGLNRLGRRAYFAKAILLTGVCNLAGCATLVTFFSATGAAMSFVFAEVLLFVFVSRAYLSAEHVSDSANVGGAEASQP